MGNTVSNVFGRRETRQLRKARLQASTDQARSRLRNTVHVDTRLALRNETEHAKAAMVSMMDQQLMRSGKPFTKADLVGILLYSAVLRGVNPLQIVRTSSMLTNDELRVKIRQEMYASQETLTALQHLGTGGMPVAAYATVPGPDLGPGSGSGSGSGSGPAESIKGYPSLASPIYNFRTRTVNELYPSVSAPRMFE